MTIAYDPVPGRNGVQSHQGCVTSPIGGVTSKSRDVPGRTSPFESTTWRSNVRVLPRYPTSRTLTNADAPGTASCSLVNPCFDWSE